MLADALITAATLTACYLMALHMGPDTKTRRRVAKTRRRNATH